MFITRLYRHNKIAAICFLLFIAAFIFLNYKWGVVASPIYQLGMYSGVMYKSDTQHIYTLYVNDKALLLSELPYAHNDMLLVTLSRFADQELNNQRILDVFNNLSLKIANKSLPSATYKNKVTPQEFTEWYKSYLRKIGVPVKKLQVYSNQYVWNKEKLIPIGSLLLEKNIVSDK